MCGRMCVATEPMFRVIIAPLQTAQRRTIGAASPTQTPTMDGRVPSIPIKPPRCRSSAEARLPEASNLTAMDGLGKMRPRVLIGASLALLLAGCVSSAKPMRNAQGQVVTCKASGFGWLGAPVALISQGECLKKLRAQGYYALDENPAVALPQKAINYQSKVRLSLPAGWSEEIISSEQKRTGVRYYWSNITLDSSLLVSAVRRDAIADMTAYVEARKRAVSQSGLNPEASEVTFLRENERNTWSYTTSTTLENKRFKYLNVFIEGKDEVVVFSAWTSVGNYDSIESDLMAIARSVAL